jgi:hypothetical protein
LYVLELVKFPGVYHIGHTNCIERRKKEHERSSPSFAVMRIVEPGLGWAESAVQNALRAHQEPDSPSHEWFRVDLETIRAVILAVRQTSAGDSSAMSLYDAPQDAIVVIYSFLTPQTWWKRKEIMDGAAVSGVCRDAHKMMAPPLQICLQKGFQNLKESVGYFDADCNELRGEVVTLQEEAEALQEQIDALRAVNQDLQDRLANR